MPRFCPFRIFKLGACARTFSFVLILCSVIISVRLSLRNPQLIRSKDVDIEGSDHISNLNSNLDYSSNLDSSTQVQNLNTQPDFEPDSNSNLNVTSQNLSSILKLLTDKSGIKLILLDRAMFKPDFSLHNLSSVWDDKLPNKVISFGILEENAQNFENFFKNRLSGSGYRLINSRGIDYRQMKSIKSKSKYKEITTHYFLFLDPTLFATSVILHLAIIFPRRNYFWLADLSESILPPQYRYLTHLKYAIPLPMGIEKFECKNHSLQLMEEVSAIFCAPLDLDFYLWQLPKSKFTECHFQDVVYPFRSKFPHMGHLEDTSNQTEAMSEIMRISKENRISTILTCGTLLGWYRQCDYIVESKDVDVGVMINEYKYEFFKQLFESEVLNLILRIGTLSLGLEFRTYTRKGGIWLDVFFLYPQGTGDIASYMWANRRWYETIWPSPRGVCSAELFGILVFIPCNYDQFVTRDYGPHGWFVPHTGSYANLNMQYKKEFNETDEPFMYYRYDKGGCQRPDELWGCDEMPPQVINSTAYQQWLAEKKT